MEIELKDFVSATLSQVISGVKAAQAHAESEGALINPRGFSPTKDDITSQYYLDPSAGKQTRVRFGQNIEFDVAVTTIERDQVEGSVGFLVAVFGAGVKGKEEAEIAAVSRIKFSVPIFLPQQSG